MIMSSIKRISAIESIPHSKHSTEDPNERRRRQLMLVHGYSPKNIQNNNSAFNKVMRDTVTISEEGMAALKKLNNKL